jgi:hypothetical protein
LKSLRFYDTSIYNHQIFCALASGSMMLYHH